MVRIPKSVMTRVADELPSVRERMHELVMRRLARYYWVSLATSGAPGSRVAAALVSRLALEDRDFGVDRRIAVRQTDIARLTTMSRSGVSVGLAELVQGAGGPLWGDRPGGALPWRGAGAGRRPAQGLRLPRHAHAGDPPAADRRRRGVKRFAGNAESHASPRGDPTTDARGDCAGLPW